MGDAAGRPDVRGQFRPPAVDALIGAELATVQLWMLSAEPDLHSTTGAVGAVGGTTAFSQVSA